MTASAESFEQRHRIYRDYVRDHSQRIGRSHFWAQLSSEFHAEFQDGRLVNLGTRARVYSPELGKLGPGPMQEGAYRFLYRLGRWISAKCDAWTPPDLRWQWAYTELGLHKSATPFSAFNHPILGSGKCRLTQNVLRMHYFFSRIFPYIKDVPDPHVLEIGAGAGMLAILFQHALRGKYVIVDLPEMIVLSCGVIRTLLPDARIVLPNEIGGRIPLASADVVFLWPDQAELIEPASMDLAINTSSFMEMKTSEIADYFDLVQSSVKHNGLFYCCNRIEKSPGLGDTEVRHFFAYPWRPQNEDVYLQEALFIRRSGGHLHLERLQRIKQR